MNTELTNQLQKLEALLGVSFTDRGILLSAVTHRSYLNEHRDATHEHNERLEFLGDAVLELAVTDFLFRKYAEKPEGELTAVRAALVNTVSLSEAATTLGLNEHRDATHEHNERLEFLGDAVLELAVTDFLFRKYAEKPEGELTAVRAALVNTVSLSEAATTLGLNEFLLMSKGEAKDTGRARQYILANAFEACIGAIYIDQGYDAAQAFIARELFARTEEIVEKRLWQDAKSRFQELAQEHSGVTPTYELLAQAGPDHDRVFTVGVYIGKEHIAEGEGRSKQEAEQSAAERAIMAKGWQFGA